MGKLKSVAELRNIINLCEDRLASGELKKKDAVKYRSKLAGAQKELEKIMSEDNTGMRV